MLLYSVVLKCESVDEKPLCATTEIKAGHSSFPVGWFAEVRMVPTFRVRSVTILMKADKHFHLTVQTTTQCYAFAADLTPLVYHSGVKLHSLWNENEKK